MSIFDSLKIMQALKVIYKINKEITINDFLELTEYEYQHASKAGFDTNQKLFYLLDKKQKPLLDEDGVTLFLVHESEIEFFLRAVDYVNKVAIENNPNLKNSPFKEKMLSIKKFLPFIK